MRLPLAFLCCAALVAAEHGEVLAVLGPDRLAIQYYQLPVVVRLAEIEIPPEQADQAQARLGEATGKKANLTWAPELGADDGGTPRVHASIGSTSATLSEVLVEAGLARFAPLGQGGRQRERLAAAEAKAKKAKAGVWAVAATAAPEPAPAAAKPAKAAGDQFVAEVDGKHFYPADAPEAARLNAKRLVRYASEAAARKAGKQPYAPSAPGAIATLDEARAAYNRAKALCEQAAGQGPTEERDKLYERAFLELSGAMQVFSAAAEAKPNDEALGEELRQCTQLRYAAMKSKRYH